MRRLLLFLAGAVLLVPAAPASASWVRAKRVAGPGQILRVGNGAIAADGTGAVAYVRRTGDRKHHDRDRSGFIVRLKAGRFSKPVGIAHGAVDDIKVAAGTDGRLAIVWIAKGSVIGLVSGHGAVAAPVVLGTAAHPGTLQVAVNGDGTGYAVWTSDGAGGADVHAARLDGNTWTTLGAPLDADPTRSAGTGKLRPQIAVTHRDEGVAAWGETYPDGSTHVFARRLTGTDVPVAPLEANAVVVGTETGGSADSPRVDAEAAGNGAWVAFRQDVGTRSRSLARRLDVSFSEPVALDGGSTSSTPVLAASGASSGVGVTGGADGTVLATLIGADGSFAPPVRLDQQATRSPVEPLAAWSDQRAGGEIAFEGATGKSTPVAYGRLATQGADFGRLYRISASGAGRLVGGSLRLGADAAADGILPMLQGSKRKERRLTVALQDAPPGPPRIAAHWYAGPHPRLTWIPGDEAFGPQHYELRLDNRTVGHSRSAALRLDHQVPDGRHTAQVIATDGRKQSTTGPERRIVVDSVKPDAKVVATRRGHVMKVRVRSHDDRSGVATVTVRWRDGTTSTSTHRRRTFKHRFKSKRAQRVTVVIRDRAGNRTARYPRA